MATIGLDKLYYAPITENEAGEETYGTPAQLAKAISADLSVELAEATLYADDGASEVVKEFKSGTLSLGVDDIGKAVAAALTGVTIDDNGVIISASEDGGEPVAVGFRAKRSNGKYRYFWLYRVKFGIPSTSLATKGDSIAFNTPTIEGTVMRRNKADESGKHPWKSEVTDGDTGVTETVITNWYSSVYEPAFTGITLSALTISNVTLTPTFSSGTTSYTGTTSSNSSTITAAAETGATVTIKVNGTTVSSGGTATWTTGSNTVVITVTKNGRTKTYNVTVTK